MWLLLADVGESTALSGGAGWAGAGLLGLVLGWLLLKHLPDLARERKEKSESRDAIIRSIMDRHAESLSKERAEFLAALSESRKDFKDSLQYVAANDAAAIKSLTDAISREIVVLQKTIESLKDK